MLALSLGNLDSLPKLTRTLSGGTWFEAGSPAPESEPINRHAHLSYCAE